jgi:hypothetical protein
MLRSARVALGVVCRPRHAHQRLLSVARAPLIGSGTPLRAPKGKPKAGGSGGAASGPGAEPAFFDDAGDIEADVAASKDLAAQMQKHVDFAKRELAKLRSATASPSASPQPAARAPSAG